jgi:ANTAR domain
MSGSVSDLHFENGVSANPATTAENVATQLCDQHGVVVGTEGFCVDMMPAVQVQAVQVEVAAEVAKFAESRAVIEQAKGMLMSVYGICADSAFDLLKWRSQEGNVKVRLVAEQITCDFVALAKRRGATPMRGEYDNLLLTVDLRITDAESADISAAGERR